VRSAQLFGSGLELRLISPGDCHRAPSVTNSRAVASPMPLFAAGNQRRLVCQSHDSLHPVVALLN
jgi:hypothetical protein